MSAWADKQKQGARVSFASEDLFWGALTPKRWGLLTVMAGQGSMAIREIARRVKRDADDQPNIARARRDTAFSGRGADGKDRGQAMAGQIHLGQRRRCFRPIPRRQSPRPSPRSCPRG
jgi:predicted transcriptional regulator